ERVQSERHGNEDRDAARRTETREDPDHGSRQHPDEAPQEVLEGQRGLEPHHQVVDHDRPPSNTPIGTGTRSTATNSPHATSAAPTVRMRDGTRGLRSTPMVSAATSATSGGISPTTGTSRTARMMRPNTTTSFRVLVDCSPASSSTPESPRRTEPTRISWSISARPRTTMIAATARGRNPGPTWLP